MKRVVRGLLFGILFGVGGLAFANHIPLDNIIASTDLDPNGEATQLNYLINDLGFSSDITIAKLADSGGDSVDGNWFQDGSNWYYDLGFVWGAVLLELGNKVYLASDLSMSVDTLVVRNSTDDTYLVLSTDWFRRYNQGHDEFRSVNDVGFVSTVVSVPEPGTLVLLGSALLGFGINGMRRRKLNVS